jgi:hypothetical protein
MGKEELEFLEFVFENCDTAKITASQVKVCIGNVEKRGKYFHACQLFIVLKLGKLSKYKTEFQKECKYSKTDTNFLTRLDGRDITSICLYYKGCKKEKQVYVPWVDDNGDEFTNRLQRNKITAKDFLIHWGIAYKSTKPSKPAKSSKLKRVK